jgi:hypothetical protein
VLTLDILFIMLFICSIFLLCFSTFIGHQRLVIVASVSALLLMNNPCIASITESLGFGVPIILMSLVTLCLFTAFRINPFYIPSHVVSISGVSLLLVLFSAIFSLYVSDDVIRSSKAVFSLLFIVFIGWFIFGKIYRKYANHSRRIIILMSDVVGFLSLLTVTLLMIFGGPATLGGEFGTDESRISIFGMTVQRLQSASFPATGLGIASGIAVLWLFSVYQRNINHQIIKYITIILMTLSFVGLIWSGSRGAIVAFFATWLVSKLVFYDYNRKRILRKIIGVVALSGGAICFFKYIFPGILYRGGNVDAPIPLSELFLSSRIDLFGPSVYLLFKPSFFGHGFGLLSAGDTTTGFVNIESFFLRLYIELGIVGSIIYILTFALLTVYVFKVDRYYFLKGERGAMFPSAILFFTWMNTPTSFGFSLPVGMLAIQLGIASGSLLIWHSIKNQLTYSASRRMQGILGGKNK